MPGPLIYWRTIRHLRPVQIWGRLRFRLARPSVQVRAAPSVRERTGDWTPPAKRLASLVAARRFRFLGVERDVPASTWNDPAVDKLWNYNLNYFDDLNAADASSRAPWHARLLSDWVTENPVGLGVPWEPYPTSLRIVNWIKWSLGGGRLTQSSLESLATQARWLMRRLERHLLGNHLFANAKALVFAGAFFDGPEADAWLRTGLGILRDEVAEQILPDGGHFELSTMYHALACEDVLDLCNVAAAYRGINRGLDAASATWSACVPPMQRWLHTMCHPDGEIALFNDAAFDVAPRPLELRQYARRLGFEDSMSSVRTVVLAASGYVRVERDDMVAILDAARVGPDYLPAHAHADTLTFELSLFGQRVLVNSGTSTYATNAQRSRERGTAAHNTVVLDGDNSSEVWGAFRVGRRARPHHFACEERGVTTEVQCAHDGYSHLPGSPIHARRWTVGSGQLMVHDTVTARHRQAASYWHLHPAVRVTRPPSGDGTVSTLELTLAHGQTVRVSFRGMRVRLTPSAWHPRFGCSQPNACLVGEFEASETLTDFRWLSV